MFSIFFFGGGGGGGVWEVFRWVAPEPRCALVIKDLLRAAALAGYSNVLHQFVSYF